MSDAAKKGFTGGDIVQMMKLGFTLAIFAAVACFALALVNNATAPVIAEIAKAKTQAAMRAVFSDADDFEEITDFSPASNGVTITNMYIAKKGGSPVGVVTRAAGATFERSTLIVAQDLSNTLTGVEVLETSDSPGFGKRMEDRDANGKQIFTAQFAGKSADGGFTAGGNFDILSGATVSSRGVATILTEATSSASKYAAGLK